MFAVVENPRFLTEKQRLMFSLKVLLLQYEFVWMSLDFYSCVFIEFCSSLGKYVYESLVGKRVHIIQLAWENTKSSKKGKISLIL